jgi:serine/threonine protein kinase
MCLIEWLLGEPAPELTLEQLQEKLVEAYPWAASMRAALGDAGSRPSAEELARILTPEPKSQAEALSAATNEFSPGGVVGGRYRIEEKLGEGGFAVTWKVFDKWPGHHKVLKQFKVAVPETLREEYQAANQLTHDCCGRVYDIQIDKTPPYLVQEYVEGRSLDVVGINRSLKELRQIAEHVLSGLAYIHAKDLLHGDVTPANSP